MESQYNKLESEYNKYLKIIGVESLYAFKSMLGAWENYAYHTLRYNQAK